MKTIDTLVADIYSLFESSVPDMSDDEVDNIIAALSKAIDDLAYRLYTLEDSVAEINAYVEEQKGEYVDA